MRITNIEKNPSTGLYYVYFEPNWLEKLFGKKRKIVKYKDTFYSLHFTREDGETRIPYFDKDATALKNYINKF